VEAKLRAAGLRGGVVSPASEGTTMVLVQRSQTPEVYVIGVWQVLQIVIDGIAACARLNLKSKLDRVVEPSFDLRPFPMSEAEERCGLGACVVRSLFLAFSTARLSYSSHNLAVFAGVQGGGRGSLNGDVVLASGEDWCGTNMVETELAIVTVPSVYSCTRMRQKKDDYNRSCEEERSEPYQFKIMTVSAMHTIYTCTGPVCRSQGVRHIVYQVKMVQPGQDHSVAGIGRFCEVCPGSSGRRALRWTASPDLTALCCIDLNPMSMQRQRDLGVSMAARWGMGYVPCPIAGTHCNAKASFVVPQEQGMVGENK
jgi:hypothetical protein